MALAMSVLVSSDLLVQEELLLYRGPQQHQPVSIVVPEKLSASGPTPMILKLLQYPRLSGETLDDTKYRVVRDIRTTCRCHIRSYLFVEILQASRESVDGVGWLCACGGGGKSAICFFFFLWGGTLTMEIVPDRWSTDIRRRY